MRSIIYAAAIFLSSFLGAQGTTDLVFNIDPFLVSMEYEPGTYQFINFSPQAIAEDERLKCFEGTRIGSFLSFEFKKVLKNARDQGKQLLFNPRELLKAGDAYKIPCNLLDQVWKLSDQDIDQEIEYLTQAEFLTKYSLGGPKIGDPALRYWQFKGRIWAHVHLPPVWSKMMTNILSLPTTKIIGVTKYFRWLEGNPLPEEALFEHFFIVEEQESNATADLTEGISA